MKIYKYCRLTENVLLSVSNGKYFASDPKAFNDPRESDIICIIIEYLNKIIDMNNGTSVEYQYIYKATSIQISKLIGKIKNIKVGCFTIIPPIKSRDSYLMWSHYADSHNGVCIEYDILDTKEFIPIQYESYETYVKLKLELLMHIYLMAGHVALFFSEFVQYTRLFLENPDINKLAKDDVDRLIYILGHPDISTYESDNKIGKELIEQIKANSLDLEFLEKLLNDKDNDFWGRYSILNNVYKQLNKESTSEDIINRIKKMLLLKDKCWSYENEYRLILDKLLLEQNPSKIYIGSSVSKSRATMIKHLLNSFVSDIEHISPRVFY